MAEKMLTIGDIPREGNGHLQITFTDLRLRSITLTRIRSGLWVVTDNGTNLLKTDDESEAVAKFLKLTTPETRKK